MKEVSINEKMKLSEHLASPSEAALSHSNKLDGLRLSPHFTLGELTKTSYITSDGNIPSRKAIENLKNLCENWLEDLRYSYGTLYGHTVSPPNDQTTPNPIPEQGSPTRSLSYSGGEVPLVISSGFRSEEVNRLCGGAKGSNHLTGCAVDIKCYGPEHMIRMAGILLDISDGTKRDFDELILEKRGTTYWIHFAVRPEDRSAAKGDASQSKNRRKILFDCR
jgi:hypothetical protein